MKVALVTSLGSVAADIVIKNLRLQNFKIIGCDIYPREWVADSNNVDVFYKAPYAAEKEKYLSFIKDVCTAENIKYVLPLIDPEVDLLNLNRDWFEQHNITLCIPPMKSLEMIRNKKILQDFIKQNLSLTAVKPIPTLKMKDIVTMPWSYPVVCKPVNGRSSQGLQYIYSTKQWDEFIKTVDPDLYIVEPYIDGPIIVVDIVRQSNPGKVIAISRKEILSTPHGCGTTVYVYQDKELEENCCQLADALDILGCVNFEFIYNMNENTYYFVECNPRFSAGCEFSCMSGYDCIGNHIKCFDGESIDDFPFHHCLYIARKYEEYITKIEC